MVELAAPDDHRLELPWHLQGEVELPGGGRWVADSLDDEFATEVERYEPAAAGPLRLRARAGDGSVLTLHLDVAGDLLRLEAPGCPDPPRRCRSSSSGRTAERPG
jgi:hypothetical protein